MSKKGLEKLSEAELIEKLAESEKRELSFKCYGLYGAVIGLIGFIICMALGLALNLIFLAIIIAGAICYYMGVRLQKEAESLVREHLGGFFESELKRVFGPRMDTKTMQVTEPFLKELRPVEQYWDECFNQSYYEGIYHGVHFSAENVELCEVDDHPENAKPTYTTVFNGVVLRCKDICDPALDIVLRGNGKDHRQSDLISHANFSQYFSVRTADNQPADDLVTPQLRELVQKLESVDNSELVSLETNRLKKILERLESRDDKHRIPALEDDVREKLQNQENSICYAPITALILHDGEAILFINGYAFASGIPSESTSLKDLDMIRKRYTASLYPIGRLIDILQDFRGKI